jgi:hypothetical protein
MPKAPAKNAAAKKVTGRADLAFRLVFNILLVLVFLVGIYLLYKELAFNFNCEHLTNEYERMNCYKNRGVGILAIPLVVWILAGVLGALRGVLFFAFRKWLNFRSQKWELMAPFITPLVCFALILIMNIPSFIYGRDPWMEGWIETGLYFSAIGAAWVGIFACLVYYVVTIFRNIRVR